MIGTDGALANLNVHSVAVWMNAQLGREGSYMSGQSRTRQIFTVPKSVSVHPTSARLSVFTFTPFELYLRRGLAMKRLRLASHWFGLRAGVVVRTQDIYT